MKLRQLLCNYHIKVYPENAGGYRSLRLAKAVPCLLLLFFSGLLLFDGLLAFEVLQAKKATYDYSVAEKERVLLRAKLLAEASELAELRREYLRVDELNRKLKVMLNMDFTEEFFPMAQGGAGLSFERSCITPYSMPTLARNMQRGVSRLESDMLEVERVQQAVLRQFRHNRNILDWTPSVWPVKGRITSGFGMRNHPFDKYSRMHQGIDIVPPAGRGAPIVAPANGKVIFVGRKDGYGLTLMIKHQGGLETKYAHLSKVAVKVGQIVERDDIVAFVGNTGRSTGPHLHYEVRLQGKAFNPKRYILN